MTSGETASSEENIKDRFLLYASRIDEDTQLWSGGFERHEAFGKIIDLKEKALPLLLEELADRSDGEDRHNPGWRLQAVGTTAAILGKKIEYPREIRGRLELIREATLEWGVKQGYIDQDQTEFA